MNIAWVTSKSPANDLPQFVQDELHKRYGASVASETSAILVMYNETTSEVVTTLCVTWDKASEGLAETMVEYISLTLDDIVKSRYPVYGTPLYKSVLSNLSSPANSDSISP